MYVYIEMCKVSKGYSRHILFQYKLWLRTYRLVTAKRVKNISSYKSYKNNFL